MWTIPWQLSVARGFIELVLSLCLFDMDAPPIPVMSESTLYHWAECKLIHTNGSMGSCFDRILVSRDCMSSVIRLVYTGYTSVIMWCLTCLCAGYNLYLCIHPDLYKEKLFQSAMLITRYTRVPSKMYVCLTTSKTTDGPHCWQLSSLTFSLQLTHHAVFEDFEWLRESLAIQFTEKHFFKISK